MDEEQLTADIRIVDEDIRSLKKRTEEIDRQIARTSDPESIKALRQHLDRIDQEKNLLRQEKNLLRQEKNLLLQGKNLLLQQNTILLQDRANLRDQSLRPANAAELPSAGDKFQRFVRSAAQNYQEWERGKKNQTKPGYRHWGKKRKTKPGDRHNKFLEVDGDPFGSFDDRFLIFIRKSYEDLKKIFMEAGQGQRYIVMGTAGIGKSLFTIFWICYLATLKRKVVWKLANNHYYLLDFSLEVAVARGPVEYGTHPDLQPVFLDPSSWLIIDGKQEAPLEHGCRMLLACSAKKTNHHEFNKHGKCTTYYLPVWAVAEINEFYNDSEEHKSMFSGMHVPDRQKALANFKELGVPRYVLDERKSQGGIARFKAAIGKVGAENCLQILGGFFVEDVSDCLIHMFVNKEDHMSVDKETDYTKTEFRFASSVARERIIEHFDKAGRIEVVGFLQKHIYSQMFGNTWGHLYELVAHVIMSRGGKFKRKRVFEDTAADGGTEEFDQVKLKFVNFEKVEELKRLKQDLSGVYCKPSSLNFQSVNAVIVPNTLVQFFKSSKGNHGYKIQGLKVLDEALKMESYNVWSCVPVESFNTTKFQNWLNQDGTKCKFKDEESKALVRKMQQYVVEVDFRAYYVATKSDKDKSNSFGRKQVQ